MMVEDPCTLELSGWGRTVRRTSQVRRPASDGDLVEVILAEPEITVRGAGRSYGDAALPGSGVVVDMTARNRIMWFDQGSGVIVVEAGVLLKEIAEQALPLGWMLPVTPGTERITIGGAIASDVHGKNHPGAGSFGNHVLWLSLLQSNGTIVELSAGQDPDAFWATIGGMGLTGVIVEAAIQLRRVETGWAIRNRLRTGSLDESLAAMHALADRQRADPGRHAIAWLDARAGRGSVGRGVVDEFYPASANDLPGSVPVFPESRRAVARQIRSLPGPGVVSRATIAAVSAVRWHLTSSANSQLVPLRSALCPLDRVESWPAAFGRSGLVQYQIAVPPDRADVIWEVLAFLAAHHMGPAVATVRNLGSGIAAPLSFPIAGWTLAVDIPARWLPDAQMLRPVDKLIADAGGRVFLAEDSVTDPDLVSVMYPRLETWRRTQHRLDPAGRWTSALSDRLRLLP